MAAFTDKSIMPWGKYKGKKMANVPADYLLWVFENNKCSYDVALYVRDNMDVLQKQVKETRPEKEE